MNEMNTGRKAQGQLVSFLESDDKVLLLTGTHQDRKHLLALTVVLNHGVKPWAVLFRANGLANAADFLGPLLGAGGVIGRSTHRFKPGSPLRLGAHSLYVDTMNRRTWSSTPRGVDVALVYPIDAMQYSEAEECVEDLFLKGVKKVILVSWTDNQDFSWAQQFAPARVQYDAEAEDPDYHARVKECTDTPSPASMLRRVPGYADSVPSTHLVKILCRGRCRGTRWARLNRPYPGGPSLKKADMGEYTATCLVCGYEAIDNYNWFR